MAALPSSSSSSSSAASHQLQHQQQQHFQRLHPNQQLHPHQQQQQQAQQQLQRYQQKHQHPHQPQQIPHQHYPDDHGGSAAAVASSRDLQQQQQQHAKQQRSKPSQSPQQPFRTERGAFVAPARSPHSSLAAPQTPQRHMNHPPPPSQTQYHQQQQHHQHAPAVAPTIAVDQQQQGGSPPRMSFSQQQILLMQQRENQSSSHQQQQPNLPGISESEEYSEGGGGGAGAAQLKQNSIVREGAVGGLVGAPRSRMSAMTSNPQLSLSRTASNSPTPTTTTTDSGRRSPPNSSSYTTSAASSSNSIDTVHRTYKQQTSARMGKLSKFFGTAPPLDISVPEIEKNGLKAALMSKIPLAYFLYALLEDYSCENLFFFLEVEHYVATQFADDVPVVLSARWSKVTPGGGNPTTSAGSVASTASSGSDGDGPVVGEWGSGRMSAAQHIVDTYLSRNSNFEINIDDRVRRDVVTTLAAARATGAGQAVADRAQPLPLASVQEPRLATLARLKTVFDAAQRAVLLLLESSWQKFIRGDVFVRLRHDIGSAHLDLPQAREAAVALLVSYLEKKAAPLLSHYYTYGPATSHLYRSTGIDPHTRSTHSDMSSSSSHSNNNNNHNSNLDIPEINQAALRRHLLVRHMIHEYCRTLLRVEFQDEDRSKLVQLLTPTQQKAPRPSISSSSSKTLDASFLTDREKPTQSEILAQLCGSSEVGYDELMVESRPSSLQPRLKHPSARHGTVPRPHPHASSSSRSHGPTPPSTPPPSRHEGRSPSPAGQKKGGFLRGMGKLMK